MLSAQLNQSLIQHHQAETQLRPTSVSTLLLHLHNTFQSNWRMKITCFEWDQKIWAKTLLNTNFTNNLQISAESYLPRFQTYWINFTISTEVQKKTEKLIFSADHLWHLLYVIQNHLLCVIQKRLFVRYLILRKIKMCIRQLE